MWGKGRGHVAHVGGWVPLSAVHSLTRGWFPRQDASPFANPEAFSNDMDAALDRAKATEQRDSGDIWQWGKIDREDAVKALQHQAQGTFLIRESTSSANSFSISVVQDGEVRHVKIHNVKGGFAINPKVRKQFQDARWMGTPHPPPLL